jgi:hypothetical protein
MRTISRGPLKRIKTRFMTLQRPHAEYPLQDNDMVLLQVTKQEIMIWSNLKTTVAENKKCYFFYFGILNLIKMNNYNDQPPRKLFGLALIEYKKIKANM